MFMFLLRNERIIAMFSTLRKERVNAYLVTIRGMFVISNLYWWLGFDLLRAQNVSSVGFCFVTCESVSC